MAAFPSPGGVSKSSTPAEIARLTRYLERLAGEGFYGKVVVSFQNGKPCDVKIEQTKKLDEL
jgi:hypothetical protein